MHYDYHANGFRFDSHLADFRWGFVFFLYIFSGLSFTFRR